MLPGDVVSIHNHSYRIEYNGREHEIVCPRYVFADGAFVMVIPWYLIPGRPYPIQVYLHACSLYSSNPEIGQRGAAEATRKQFKLTTFSHTTVGRSFKAFEQSCKPALNGRFGEEAKVCAANGSVAATAASHADTEDRVGLDEKRRFPAVTDTLKRRVKMHGFFPKAFQRTKRADIERTCSQFVERFHKKSGRLLL